MKSRVFPNVDQYTDSKYVSFTSFIIKNIIKWNVALLTASIVLESHSIQGVPCNMISSYCTKLQLKN